MITHCRVLFIWIPSEISSGIFDLLILVEYLIVLCYRSNHLCLFCQHIRRHIHTHMHTILVFIIASCISRCIPRSPVFSPTECVHPLSNRVSTFSKKRLSLLIPHGVLSSGKVLFQFSFLVCYLDVINPQLSLFPHWIESYLTISLQFIPGLNFGPLSLLPLLSYHLDDS